MLTNFTVVTMSQYLCYQIVTLYSLDLNTIYIICQVYLFKMGCGTWRENLTLTNFLLTKSYQRKL